MKGYLKRERPQDTSKVTAMIKVKLIRSKIGCTPKQRQVLAALGLRKLHMVKEHNNNDAVRGMIAKVCHMVEVTE